MCSNHCPNSSKIGARGGNQYGNTKSKNNGVCTLLVNYIPDYEKMPLEQLIGGNINIVIGSIVSFIIFYLSIKALNLKLPKVDNQESMAHEGINEIAITYKEQKR